MNMLIGLFGLISLGGFCGGLVGIIVKKISNGNTRKPKRIMLLSVLLFVATMVVGVATSDEQEDPPAEEIVVDESKSPATEEVAPGLAFLDDFTEYGYTAEQIEAMKEVLVNVGITEIVDLEIGNVVSGMQVIKGLAHKDESFVEDLNQRVQVQFNIENGVLFLVHIYCPSYHHENSVTYLSGLEDRRAELYYDTKGGYLKKIDWESRTVIDY